jgi:hypothetical protein
MERYELQKLRDLPIEGVAQRLGLNVVRHKSLCPFHDDHHASLSFSVRRNSYRCFVCGASGGTIDLVMRYLNKDFKEACRWLADEHNVIIDHSPLTIDHSLQAKRTSSSAAAQKPFDASRYERFFERPWLSPEARRFLFEERRLDPRVVRWCRLTSWRDRQGVPWLQIPYYDQQGRLVGVQNRNLIRGASPRFRFPSGSRCSIYNLPILSRLRPGDDLYITEGCSDCWAMLSAGHKAIAIPSATLLTKKDKELLSMLHSAQPPGSSKNCPQEWSMVNGQWSIKYHMYPDNDTPGERLFLQLQQILPSLVHHQLPPGCKDFSEYYLSQF